MAEGWREVVRRTCIPFDARPALGRFDARATRIALGPVALVETRHGRGTCRRGNAEIAATDGDPMGILVLRSGRLALTLGDRATIVRPGEALLWDGERRGSFEALEPVVKSTLIVSRERLRAVMPCYEAILGRILPAHSATVRLLRGYLDVVAPLGQTIDEAAGEAAGATALELARVALGSGDRLDRATSRAALVAEIRRHIVGTFPIRRCRRRGSRAPTQVGPDAARPLRGDRRERGGDDPRAPTRALSRRPALGAGHPRRDDRRPLGLPDPRTSAARSADATARPPEVQRG